MEKDKLRYENMKYSRCGKSGLLLPKISLGLWHNFAGVDVYENAKEMVLRAFDLGITQTGGLFNSARGVGFSIGQKIVF